MIWQIALVLSLVAALAAYELVAFLSQRFVERWSWPTITEMVRRSTATWGAVARASLFVAMVATGVFLAGHFLYGWL